MPELERDHRDGACNEPQPFNWKHACQLKTGHKGDHRVAVGEDDLAWSHDGPVEVVKPKTAGWFVGGRS